MKPLTSPGEGERRAQRGYTSQYAAAAAAIYSGLDRGELRWVGLADRCADIADDVVLGFDDVVIGHQFKSSIDPGNFRISTLLTGADGLLPGLVEAWRQLRTSCPGKVVKIRIVIPDVPSTNDSLVDGGGTTADFINDWKDAAARSLVEWRATRWSAFIESIFEASGLGVVDFDQFLGHLELVHGAQPDFRQRYAINAQSQPLVERIADVLPHLVAQLPAKDRWTREEFLKELDWPEIAPKHQHHFPIGQAVQSNPVTESALRAAVAGCESGYVSLVGPPGTGKSTLLQIGLETESIYLVRYLAYVPGAAQGIGRAEADDFLADVSVALRDTGLRGLRFRWDSTLQRREEFAGLLREAGERYEQGGLKTVIVVDGLDHVPREEQPTRSFLNELPLPASTPKGVVFVLGTQRMDLPGIPTSVIDEALGSGRKVDMKPLPFDATSAMADRMGLRSDVPRIRVFELAEGHPLATRYLIEALLVAGDIEARNALLDAGLDYSGDIEAVYRAAWRGIQNDTGAQDVLHLVAHAEAPLDPELLAQTISPTSIEHAWSIARHLLARVPSGWSIFHNSFRLFVRRQQRLRYGEVDPDHSCGLYSKLAEIARRAPADSPQRHLELRYLLRAQRHREALSLATPALFREQFLAGRSARDIQDDIRLAFGSLVELPDATVAFGLLLASDEVGRRSTALEQAEEIVDALLALGDIAAAEQFVEDFGGDGFLVVDAWLVKGNTERARVLFERIEPLHSLSNKMGNSLSLSRNEELTKWASRAVHFRTSADVVAGIERIVELARHAQHDFEQPDELSRSLRSTAAQAALGASLATDLNTVLGVYGVHPDDQGALSLDLANSLFSRGKTEEAVAIVRRLLQNKAQLSQALRGSRLDAALHVVVRGHKDVATSLLEGVSAPAISEEDDDVHFDYDSSIVHDVIDYAELTTLLGHAPASVQTSKRQHLRPLQYFCEKVGQLLARFRNAPDSVAADEVVGMCATFLTYVLRANPMAIHDYLAERKIRKACKTIVNILLSVAAGQGVNEFDRVVEQIDRVIAVEQADKSQWMPLLIAIAKAIARRTGRVDDAERRLDDLLPRVESNTPAQHLGDVAMLVCAYAAIGRPNRGRLLVQELRDESLGYSLAAKKDAQYALWQTLLEKANIADPERRRRRVEVLARQCVGMAQTEGKDAAYRIVRAVIVEGAVDSAGLGWAVAEQLIQSDLLVFPEAVDALMIGTVRRAPHRAIACVALWTSLCLPFYREPYFQESCTGDFVREVVALASTSDVAAVTDELVRCIEIHAQIDVRADLMKVLASAAAARGAVSERLKCGIDHMTTEIVLPKRNASSPMEYDDAMSMADLAERLATHAPGEVKDYAASRAFRRLLPSTEIEFALNAFERFASLNGDAKTRFRLINRLVTAGRLDDAKRLLAGYTLEGDENANWASFLGGARLQWFQARVRLEGESVHPSALTDFIVRLRAGGDSPSLLLYETETIWPVLTANPAWPAMWAFVEEQLTYTWDYRLGRDMSAVEVLGDSDVAFRLLRRVATLTVTEIQWHAARGAIGIRGADHCVFDRLVQDMLSGAGDDVVIGLRLLQSADAETAGQALCDSVRVLSTHDDLAVRYLSEDLLQRWGVEVAERREALPIFYQLALPGADEAIREEPLRRSRHGAPLVSDSIAWCQPFESAIKRLARSVVSTRHIQERVRSLVDGWGGLDAYGEEGNHRLRVLLDELGLKLPYLPPHIVVVMRALRHVAGELESAGLLKGREIPGLLFDLGVPTTKLRIDVRARPDFVTQPPPVQISQRDHAQWLSTVDDDIRILRGRAGELVVGEITRYRSRSSGRLREWTRARVPWAGFSAKTDPLGVYRSLPSAGRQNVPLHALVMRTASEGVWEMPEFAFALNPTTVDALGWRAVDAQGSMWVDRTGELMAEIIWWHDAAPDGRTHDDCVWGSGAAVTLSKKGLNQLETLAGRVQVAVAVRRAEYRGVELLDEAFGQLAITLTS